MTYDVRWQASDMHGKQASTRTVVLVLAFGIIRQSDHRAKGVQKPSLKPMGVLNFSSFFFFPFRSTVHVHPGSLRVIQIYHRTACLPLACITITITDLAAQREGEVSPGSSSSSFSHTHPSSESFFAIARPPLPSLRALASAFPPV